MSKFAANAVYKDVLKFLVSNFLLSTMYIYNSFLNILTAGGIVKIIANHVICNASIQYQTVIMCNICLFIFTWTGVFTTLTIIKYEPVYDLFI